MIRHLFMGVTAVSLMTGAAFAQGYSSQTTTTVTRSAEPAPGATYVAPAPAPGVTYVEPARSNPAGNVAAGGVSGAALGAGIGCLATLPIGCAPGAAVGAAIGGGTGAVVGGVASVPQPQPVYR